MIEEKLESLIKRYTIEIEDKTKSLKRDKTELEEVLKELDCLSIYENEIIGNLQKVVETQATQIFLMKGFLYDLKQLKEENK